MCLITFLVIDLKAVKAVGYSTKSAKSELPKMVLLARVNES